MRSEHALPQPIEACYVWLGDLGGFEISTDEHAKLSLTHRCGYEVKVPTHPFLAHIVQMAMEHIRSCGSDRG